MLQGIGGVIMKINRYFSAQALKLYNSEDKLDRDYHLSARS